MLLLALATTFIPNVGAALVAAPSQGRAGPVAITGVTVVDPSNSEVPLRPLQTILIENGVIRAVGPASATRVPRGYQTVDGRGKHAIPGLWDMHVHFMNAGVSALPLLLAHGVTSVREMGGWLDSTRRWQQRMDSGTLVGPRLLTPALMLESPRYLAGIPPRDVALGGRLAPRILGYRIGVADSPAAARVVDSLVRLRADFVKFRTVGSRDAYFAILREARRAGLRVAGHPPPGVSLVEAADSGQSTVEHGFFPPLSRLDPELRVAVYQAFARNGTWYTPTLTVSRAVMIASDSARRLLAWPDDIAAPRRYARQWLLDWWAMQIDERAADTAEARTQAVYRAAWQSGLDDVRGMATAGVNILAGTDAGSVLVYPGFSLHEELRLLVEEGALSPRQALWSATVGPARWAGLEGELGSIAAGFRADLVLLDGDPIASIRNTTRIFSVIQQGRVFTRRDLDGILAALRADVVREQR